MVIPKDGMDGVGRRTKKEEIDVYICLMPGGSVVKYLPANAGDMSLIPGSGRSRGEINGHPPQHSCLGNPMNKEVWWVTVHGVPKE